MFAPKFSFLPKELQLQVIAHAQKEGAYPTSRKFAQACGMSEDGLYQKLKSELKKLTKKPIDEVDPIIQKGKALEEKRRAKEGNELTKSQKLLLKRVERGEVSLEEASRIVAVRALENMMRNPTDVKLIDFYRTEFLKLKQEENKIKDTWGKEIIARFFAGKLPPKFCPHCGKPTVDDAMIYEGEEEDNARLIENTGNHQNA